MVKIKDHVPHISHDGQIHLDAWLAHLAKKKLYSDQTLLHQACLLSQWVGSDYTTETGESCFQQGLGIAEILSDLAVDQETLAAAILYDAHVSAHLSLEDIHEQFPPAVAKLVEGVERMHAIQIIQQANIRPSRTQLDNVRQMLLAMVDDVRIVLIKLAERLKVLRGCAQLSDALKRRIAHEVMQLYAPLANRLGIGQLKWEMEDLSFRYLEPTAYQAIAKGLKQKRLDREKLVQTLLTDLQTLLDKEGIQGFQVYGRAKHIHSIHRKMQEKNLALHHIYDATAVRILVETEEQCYTALSLVHGKWPHVPQEFDDYISKPKPNGYRSLHTAVTTSDENIFEVQIRTYAMHEQAECGVAAHWRYKEGTTGTQNAHEQKINWLRDILAWQRDLADNTESPVPFDHAYLDDHIYVLTPKSEVLALPKGSTPLDFAYYVHSGLGHRCRGAKVDGVIVPLQYVLKTGEQISILTGPHAKPSRDWLNAHAGYLSTSRAKAKVLHWFKQQDYDRHLDYGKTMIEKEVKKLTLSSLDLSSIAKQLNFKAEDDLLASLGRGDTRIAQVLNKIPQLSKPMSQATTIPSMAPNRSNDSLDDIQVSGLNHVLTHIAQCCQPMPGDDIIGYITIGRGISVHRTQCNNLASIKAQHPHRMVAIHWRETPCDHYRVDVLVLAQDKPKIAHEITHLCAQEKTSLLAIHCQTLPQDQLSIKLTLELTSLSHLSLLLDKLQHIPSIIQAKRLQA